MIYIYIFRNAPQKVVIRDKASIVKGKTVEKQ